MLVFDIDDTLYQRSEPYLRAYRELFRGQYALDEEALVRANHRNKEEQFHLYSEGKISFEEMTVRRTQNTFRDMGVILSGDEAAHFEQVYSSYQNSLTLHPAFRDLLDTLLAKGVPMGVLTNGLPDRQRNKLTAMRAEGYFPKEHIMASGDIGVIKPGTELFRAFEQKVGKAPDQLWMIGDSFESDIAGARKAGWHAVWLNRKGEVLPDDTTLHPDLMGGSEEEVCRLLLDSVNRLHAAE